MMRHKIITACLFIVAINSLTFADPPAELPYYDPNGIINLGIIPGGTSSFANAINDLSQVVGGSAGNLFLWDITNGMQDLGKFGVYKTWGMDINNASQIVGAFGSDYYSRAFIWDEVNGMQVFNALNKITTPLAINDIGQIVGKSYDEWPHLGGRYCGFIKTIDPNTVINLGQGVANSINNSGQVVGYDNLAFISGHWISSAWLWEDGVKTELGTFGTDRCLPQAINDSGLIVGYTSEYNPRKDRAFLYDSVVGVTDPNAPNTGFVDLNEYLPPDSEWSYLKEARDINNNGQIVGVGVLKSGGERGFVMSPNSFKKYTLTIQTDPCFIDTVTPPVGQYEYFEGWPIIISAQSYLTCPDVRAFDYWEGDVTDPGSAQTTVFIDSDKTVTAVFTMAERTCGDECHPILRGDLNEDCYINMEDFVLYIANWLACTHPDCD